MTRPADLARAHDAVVVGAGHNGLAAAIILADAGWDVLVLERNDEAGGAVRTAEVTMPGFSHDLMATNLNLFAGSQFHAEFADRLGRFGLEFVRCGRSFSSVFPDGGFVGISDDPAETTRSIGAVSAHDAEAWDTLAQRFVRWSPHLFDFLGARMPSLAALRPIASGVRAEGRRWPLDVSRLALQSIREFTEEHFESREMRALVAAWGMHLDFPPDVSGGALFSFLETFANAANGMVIGRGGARTVIDAQVRLLESLGGVVRTGAAVDSITTVAGRATGVRLESGERIEARRAVIANVTPDVLFRRLVPDGAVDDRFLRRVDGFRRGPGAMMIHLALSGPVPWVAAGAADHMYVHVGPYLDDMSRSYQQAIAGLLPERPTLAVGQPTIVDPSRAPEGHHVLWIQVRMVPSRVVGDAAEEIAGTTWGDVGETFADRVMANLETYAPGLGELVLDRHVMTPTALELANPNLVGGDSLGGSHHLMQHFFLRPFPGWSTYSTPVSNLYMCGAGTWPGAGVGAGSGYLLAKKLTRRHRRVGSR